MKVSNRYDIGYSAILKLLPADLFHLLLWTLTVSVGVLSIMVVPPSMQLALYLIFTLCFLLLFTIELEIGMKRDISFFVLVPLLISALQNVYLGYAAPYATAGQLKAMLTVNVFFAAGVAVILVLRYPSDFLERRIFYVAAFAVLLALYGAVTLVVFGGTMTSAIASLRNMESPFLFFILGLLARKRLSTGRLMSYIAALGWLVIILGFLELFFLKGMWTSLNIERLWTLKGLQNITDFGLPGNFFSSEKIGGEQVRRMVSSYADPVNLGTVLFLVFMVAWFSSRRILLIVSLAAIVATISKGAFLGVLIFMALWAYYKTRPAVYIPVFCAALLAGAGFVLYSLTHSTLSIVVHVLGFLASLKEFPAHPLGHGLGSLGVLAGQFSEVADTGVKETGLGMIIGQLGAVGLFLYAVFFWKILRGVLALSTDEKILSLSLLFAIALNITFNEVALSPNSSGGYFLFLGLYCARRTGRDTLPEGSLLEGLA